MKTLATILLIILSIPTTAQEMAGIQVMRFGDNLFLRYQLFDRQICYAGRIDEITDLPRDWTNITTVTAEKARPLTPEERAICGGLLEWKVAENIYRGKPQKTRPASIINGGGGRTRVGSECFEFVAESTGGREYRRVYTTDGYPAVAICQPVINITNMANGGQQ